MGLVPGHDPADWGAPSSGTLGVWDTPSLRDPPPLNPKVPTVSPPPWSRKLVTSGCAVSTTTPYAVAALGKDFWTLRKPADVFWKEAC